MRAPLAKCPMAAKAYPGREPRQKPAIRPRLARACGLLAAVAIGVGRHRRHPSALATWPAELSFLSRGRPFMPGAAISPVRARTGGTMAAPATGSGILRECCHDHPDDGAWACAGNAPRLL